MTVSNKQDQGFFFERMRLDEMKQMKGNELTHAFVHKVLLYFRRFKFQMHISLFKFHPFDLESNAVFF